MRPAPFLPFLSSCSIAKPDLTFFTHIPYPPLSASPETSFTHYIQYFFAFFYNFFDFSAWCQVPQSLQRNLYHPLQILTAFQNEVHLRIREPSPRPHKFYDRLRQVAPLSRFANQYRRPLRLSNRHRSQQRLSYRHCPRQLHLPNHRRHLQRLQRRLRHIRRR